MTTSIGTTGSAGHPDVLWTTRLGRGFAWLLLLSVLVAVSLLLYGGVRERSEELGLSTLTAIWGWIPSYLAALALPFVWPALGARVLKRAGPVAFLPEAAFGGGTIVLIAGTLSAFLLYRIIVRPYPTAVGEE